MFKQHEWKVGDRAKIVKVSKLMPDHHGKVGDVFEVTLVSQIGPHTLLTGLDGYKTVLGELCKPVVRVPARSHPTPRTYAEMRTMATMYPVGTWRQTGHEVFKAWDWGAKAPYVAPKYEEIGN